MPRWAGMAQFSGCLRLEHPARRDAKHGAANRHCEICDAERCARCSVSLAVESCSLKKIVIYPIANLSYFETT